MTMRYLLAPLALIAAPAFAQDALDVAAAQIDAEDLAADRVTIAFGVGSVPSYRGSDSNSWIPAGLVQGQVSGYAFYTSGLRLYVDAIRNDPGPVVDIQLGPVAGLALDRFRRKGIDDTRVEALGTRDVAVELGGFVGIGKTGVITSDYDTLSANVAVLRDLAGAHDSVIVSPTVSYATPLSTRAYAGLSLEANWVGGKYARYYFSIDPAGALASGLPTFNAKSGWRDWSLTGFVTHSITGDLLHGLGAFGGVSYARLLNSAKESPITRIAGDADQWYFAAGLTYTF